MSRAAIAWNRGASDGARATFPVPASPTCPPISPPRLPPFASCSARPPARFPQLAVCLPRPAQFAAAMSRYGVGEGVRVVLYDRFVNMWAARVWWMLRVFGFDGAAVLNGGWKKWTREGRPVATDDG